jgi:hypothetical protein
MARKTVKSVFSFFADSPIRHPTRIHPTQSPQGFHQRFSIKAMDSLHGKQKERFGRRRPMDLGGARGKPIPSQINGITSFSERHKDGF